MSSFNRFFLILVLFVATVISCKDENPEPPALAEVGKLKLNISAITIVRSSAGGRSKTVSTDNFIVKIFKVGDTDPVYSFDPWSDAPAEIELTPGEYYADAQNIDPPEAAAFDQPWYYGVSDHFTIDKEELKEISIQCKMANYKVSFHYSDNVANNFTSWSATATRASGGFLEWAQGDDSEGYFLTGGALSVHVNLQYQKQSGSGVITRDFYATINTPQAATLYRMNVDAVLENGEIKLLINVDDGFETVDIDLVASVSFSGPGDVTDIPGGANVVGSGPPQGFGKGIMTWNLSNVLLANNKWVYWGPAPDMVRGKAGANNIFQDNNPNEILDFDPASSSLAGGMLVFKGSTQIASPSGGFQQVELRFELQVVGRALIDPTTKGLPASVGGLVEINNSSDAVAVKFQMLARRNSSESFQPWLNLYDSQPKSAGQTAYSSFTGGFYWSNLTK